MARKAKKVTTQKATPEKRENREYPEATKRKVLAWCKANRAGAAKAGQYFHLPKSAIQYWITQARKEGDFPRFRGKAKAASLSQALVVYNGAGEQEQALAALQERDREIVRLKEDNTTLHRMVNMLMREANGG